MRAHRSSFPSSFHNTYIRVCVCVCVHTHIRASSFSKLGPSGLIAHHFFHPFILLIYVYIYIYIHTYIHIRLNQVLVTLGEAGSLLVTPTATIKQPACSIEKVVDATGAGMYACMYACMYVCVYICIP